MKSVQIYSKPGCSLCEQAKVVLRELQRRRPFELSEVDLRSSEDLWARFRYEVPVVVVDGEVVSTLRVDPLALEAALAP